ncbi:NnrU family protein [Paracoccus rhizosphaerae]|uniref:NnrU family protein n=1 Tax=Paracoccus rhizosphaerae TaxID=1133347 RepID=A0ABV6CIN4_9RHOB|nr:NnrU family protein [Paracoccus rhizosphaerae]
MTGWTEYTLALLLFVASHFLPRLGRLRERLIAAAGRRIYFGAYGLLSVVLLIWVIMAAGRAPYVEIWPPLPWTRWVPNLAMPLAAVLAAWGAGLPQAVTLGGRGGAAFDPHNPGVAAVSRHPLFLALALWAGSHLVANGNLAHVILFGSFLLMAVAAIPAFDAKAQRALGGGAKAYFGHTAILSFAPLTQRAWLRRNGRAAFLRGAAGVLMWLGFLHLHTRLIGVSPFPLG